MSAPLRVGLLTSAPFPPREGIGFHVFNLARELQRRGHLPTVLTRGPAFVTRRRDIDGVPVVEVPFLPAYPLHVHLHGLALQRYLQRHRADLDLLHAHTPLVPVPGGALPIVTTVHTPMRADTAAIPVNSVRSAAIRAQALVSARLELALFARSGAIVAVATSVAMELAAYGLDPGAIPVVGNAVDPDTFAPGAGPVANESILYVGRLADRKGLADLVRATAILAGRRPGVRLVLVGDGPMAPELRRLSAELGISDRVTLAGHIDGARRDDLVAAYREAAVYVQPSHYEGLPTSLLEAMACGRPAVATAISGHLDALHDDRNGLLVPARDPGSLARAIERVLADPALARRLGRAGRETVLERYSWTALADSYEQIYGRVLEASGPLRSPGFSKATPARRGDVLDAR